MRIVKAKVAQFDNTKIYVHRRSRKEGRKVDGRYVRVGGIFRLGTPDLPKVQYMGLHDHIFMTMNYPEYINDLLGVAADLPAIGENRATNWIGTTSSSICRGSLWYFIPQSVWGFREGDYDKVIKTTSYASIVSGDGSGYYYLLQVPLISRKFLRNRYREFSLRTNSERKEQK